mmetsp:Transcript_2218/g.3990  ORF Transcript_2218/g.3990 Transcript_2218/m.3990 type:complete len:163 (+) Transcript_2218:387-875(+)
MRHEMIVNLLPVGEMESVEKDSGKIVAEALVAMYRSVLCDCPSVEETDTVERETETLQMEKKVDANKGQLAESDNEVAHVASACNCSDGVVAAFVVRHSTSFAIPLVVQRPQQLVAIATRTVVAVSHFPFAFDISEIQLVVPPTDGPFLLLLSFSVVPFSAD